MSHGIAAALCMTGMLELASALDAASAATIGQAPVTESDALQGEMVVKDGSASLTGAGITQEISKALLASLAARALMGRTRAASG